MLLEELTIVYLVKQQLHLMEERFTVCSQKPHTCPQTKPDESS